MAGDLLIKLIFEEQADGMEGVQNAIDTFNAQTGSDLRSAEELFKDWVIAVYADDPDSDLFDFENVDFGPDSGNWTIQLANDLFFKNRGTYKGNVPPARFQNDPHVPQQTALPFGTSYETGLAGGGRDAAAEPGAGDADLARDIPPGHYPLRVQTAGGVSNPLPVAIDRLPQLPAAGSTPDKPVALPAALSETLSGAQQVRVYIAGKTGQKLVADVECKRLGAACFPVLELRNRCGHRSPSRGARPSFAATRGSSPRCRPTACIRSTCTICRTTPAATPSG